MIFRNPQALALLLLLPLFFVVWRWRGRRVVPIALVLRLSIVILLVFALADPVLGHDQPQRGPLVVLADQSDSLTEAGKLAVRTRAAQLAQSTGAQAQVLFFGADVVAPAPGQVTSDESANTIQEVSADPSGSDIAAALREARALIGATGGRIVLLSDGAQTQGNALAEAQLAATTGISVDVEPIVSPDVSDVRVASLTVPRTLRVGEEYPVQITLAVSGPNPPSEGHLRLLAGDTVVAEQDVPLSKAEPFTFRLTATDPGVIRLRAEISAAPDTFARNNSAAAIAIVTPPPRIILVEGQPGNARQLRLALGRAGVESDVIPSGQLPTKLSELSAFEGMVLVDVSATNLSLEQMTTVREFVRSDGKGLVAIGGRSSFSLGAYKGTPLEQVLPVTADPPPRPQRPDVAMLLMIDHSASMGSASGVSKLDMAKEAANLASETLDSDDRVGILEFDTSQDWVVNFQQIGSGLSLGQIQEQIGQIALGGGTNIYDALNVGLVQLAQQPSSVRHAVILTDGRSFTNDRAAYENLIALARRQNITLSSIAIGLDSDTELLKEIANWGGGRYYFAADAEDIPRLTLLESTIARSNPAVEGQFRADLAAAHPLLRDFAPSTMPRLNGYVATTLKPEAELVLESPEHDPVLATWQYGVGRAVAWLPSVDEPWADSWPRWDQYDRFWAQMIRYTLPDPDSGPLQVRVERSGQQATVIVDSRGPGGTPLDLATTEATFTLPDGSQRALTLQQTAPGRYSQALQLPLDGPYALTVQQSKDALTQSMQTGFVQPVPAEYLPHGDGAALLEQIAKITGGQVLRGAPVTPTPAPSAAAPSALWPWLLLTALLLWLVEIAVRRGRLFVQTAR